MYQRYLLTTCLPHTIDFLLLVSVYIPSAQLKPVNAWGFLTVKQKSLLLTSNSFDFYLRLFDSGQQLGFWNQMDMNLNLNNTACVVSSK